MALCGFNEEMVSGLLGFHNGLVEHGILDRSKKKNQTTKFTINKELSDMKEFLEQTHLINNPEVRELTEYLAKYACAFYKLVEKESVDDYKEIIYFLSQYYFNMDNKYYSELEGQKDAMKQLALYLNSISTIQPKARR